LNRDLHDIVGLAQRAGALRIGQKNIREALKNGERLLVLLTSDRSRNVEAMLRGYESRGQCRVVVMPECTRYELGHSVSRREAQIAGIPAEHGLSKKIQALTAKGGNLDE